MPLRLSTSSARAAMKRQAACCAAVGSAICVFLRVARGLDPLISKRCCGDPPLAPILRAMRPCFGAWKRGLTERDSQLLDVAGFLVGRGSDGVHCAASRIERISG